MSKRPTPRAEHLRLALAQEAARIMAEHGISDFLLAKRKAADRFGVADGATLPKNVEIEAALEQYQRLFDGDGHAESLRFQSTWEAWGNSLLSATHFNTEAGAQ